jgi:hypothetical protein
MRIFNAWRPSLRTYELLTDEAPAEQDLREAQRKLDRGSEFCPLIEIKRDVIVPRDNSGPVHRTTWSCAG